MICYLVGAGDFSGSFTPEEDDLVIAADGGFSALRERGIRCDLLLGDLDSFEGELPEVKLIRHPVMKDETDMFLAYREGVKRGYRDFRIFGGGGGREDHTYCNYSLLYAARLEGCRAAMVTGSGEVTLIRNESVTLPGEGREGKHFSAFPFGGICRDVSVLGLEYRAEHITLRPEFPYTVSNRFIGSDATVSVGEGALLLFIER